MSGICISRYGTCENTFNTFPDMVVWLCGFVACLCMFHCFIVDVMNHRDTHMHTHTHTQTHTRARHTHAHTHAQTYTHTHTHIHTWYVHVYLLATENYLTKCS